MKVLHLIFSCGILFGLSAFAEDDVEKDLDTNFKNKISHLKSNCSLGKKSFNLYIGNDLKKPEPESQQFGYTHFWISAPGKPLIAAITPKEYNEILFLKPKQRSLCKNTVAYSTPKGEIALFFRQNGRPFPDQLGVVLYDPIKHQVLMAKRDLGVSAQVEKTNAGIAFLINDSPTDVAQYEVSLRGKTVHPKESMFQYWNKLEFKSDQLVVGYERELTWKRAPEKIYFKNQTDFEKAIGYDPETEKINAVWTFTVAQPACIQISQERSPSAEEQFWHCKN